MTRTLIRIKDKLVDFWNYFSCLGIEGKPPTFETLQTKTINQITFYTLVAGVLNCLQFLLHQEWLSALICITVMVWVTIPVMLNSFGKLFEGTLSFFIIYLLIFFVYSILVAEGNAHMGVLFLAVYAVVFFRRKFLIWFFLAAGIISYTLAELWFELGTPVFDLPFSTFNRIMSGITIGMFFFLLLNMVLNSVRISESRLRNALDRWSAIIEGALDAVIVMDEKGKITEWNSRAASVFGYSREEAAGQFLHQLAIPEPYREAHTAGLQRFLKTGEGHLLNRHVEMEGLHKSGRIIPIELTIVPVKQGEEHFFCAFARDITEIKKNRERLVQVNNELHQFASVASHDLKEPIRTVAAFTDLVAEELPDNPNCNEYLQFIREATDRMTRLVNDLIAFARAESDSQTPHGVDLNEILSTVKKNLYLRIQEAKAVIEHPEMPAVLGNTSPYIQLFQNLLSNSIKFQKKGAVPRIHIDAVKAGAFWRFGIHDNGIGISPEKVGAIFQPFTRLHTEEEFEGSGIGLSTSKKIVERYGGKIWFESEPEVGTSFYFTLPVLEFE